MLTGGEGASIGSIQGPDIPLGDLVRLPFTSVYTVSLAFSIRVNKIECCKPKIEVKRIFCIFPLIRIPDFGTDLDFLWQSGPALV